MFQNKTIEFTSEELTVLSDVLRRTSPQDFPMNIFLSRDEFKTAYVKIETAKWASFKEKDDAGEEEA
jgi:hypothetical protein